MLEYYPPSSPLPQDTDHLCYLQEGYLHHRVFKRYAKPSSLHFLAVVSMNRWETVLLADNGCEYLHEVTECNLYRRLPGPVVWKRYVK